MFNSREVIAVAVLLATGTALVIGGPAAVGQLRAMMARQLSAAAGATVLDGGSVQALLFEAAVPALAVLAPLFAAAFIAAGAAGAAQSGLAISAKAIAPKFDRLSPMQGFKRLFSAKGATEGIKAVLKAAVVLPIAYFHVKKHLPELLTLQALPLNAVVLMAVKWVIGLATQVLGALAVLAAADYAVGRYRWKKDLMMTFEEVKQESKDQDGDPHIKGRRRQKARELALRPRLDKVVPEADVVITNPTHYAVALKYDPLAGAAPVVVAKGLDARALRIKAIAAEHEVPTVEDRPLARALHAAAEEGSAIPETLYAAVAAILAEVYRKKGKM